MDDLNLKTKSKRRPIDDDTKSDSGIIDGSERICKSLVLATVISNLFLFET